MASDVRVSSPQSPVDARDAAPGWSLAVAILGSTMVFVDGTVVNVALPVIQRDLRGTVSQMLWIVEAYALVLASLVLVGGALGDRLGRKRVFLAGGAIFAVASAACGLAPDATLLIVARSLQGVGGALLVPGSLALISAAYGPHERGRAIGTWSSTTAITAALGPVAGGWLVSHASFRWLFLFNLPVAIATGALLLLRVPETRDETAPSRVDIPGALLTILGLGAIVFALLDAPRMGGLTSPAVLALLAIGVVVLGLFVLVESRSRVPMVPLGLFRVRTFSGTNALTLLLYASLGGAFFFLPFNLIQVQGYSPAAAGAALVPLVVLISGMSPGMGGFVARYGARIPLVVGPSLAAAGFALLAWPSVGGSYWATFFPGIVVLGVGMGTTVAPLTTAVMGSVSSDHAGVASGVNNAIARAASVLAIAALGAVLTTRFDHAMNLNLARIAADTHVRALLAARRGELAGVDLTGIAPGARDAVRRALNEAYVSGFRAVSLACALLSALGAALAWLLVEPAPRAPRDARASG